MYYRNHDGDEYRSTLDAIDPHDRQSAAAAREVLTAGLAVLAVVLGSLLYVGRAAVRWLVLM